MPQPSKIDSTEVEQAVVLFIHCFRLAEPLEKIRQNLKNAGYTEFNCINPDPAHANWIYFEQEVYELFRFGAFKPPQPLPATSVENNLPLKITPVVYVLPLHLLLIALRVELVAEPDKPRLYPVMRFVEAFRNCIIRHFMEKAPGDRHVRINLTAEARQLHFDERHQTAEAYHLITEVFRLATGRAVREKGAETDIVFGNFAKLFVSAFYKVDGELTVEDRHQLHHFDRPYSPERPEDWFDALPEQKLIDDFQQDHSYHRWQHQKQFFGYMPFGFSMLLEPCAERAKLETALPFHFENRYHVLYFVMLVKLAYLQSMKDQLTRLEALSGNNPGTTRERLARRLQAMREELLNFSNSIWSSHISYEIQPSELYAIGHRTLKLDDLYEEIHQKLSEYDDYLRNWQQGQINKGLWILQWLLMPLAIGGFLATLMQLKPLSDWLTKAIVPPWPEILQIAIPLILPVPLVAVVYAIYAIIRKVRS